MNGICTRRKSRLHILFVAALIGVNFLWSGTAYIMQTYRLLGFLDGSSANLLVCGLYYLFQAAGVGVTSLLFAKQPRFAGGRGLPLGASVVLIASTALAAFSPSLKVVITAGIVLNIAIGLLSGCYLTRLSTDIPRQRRGLLYGSAYALGSLGTWLLSLPMGGRYLWNNQSFIALAILFLLSLLLLWLLPPLPPETQNPSRLRFHLSRGLLPLMAAVVFLMFTLNMLGFSFPLSSAAGGGVYIELTRAFYAIGLIVAGFISDKSRRWGGVSCLAALVFPFLALALGENLTGVTIMWVMAYLFLGYLSVFRAIVFADISENMNLPALAALGLAAGRLGEAAGTLGSEQLTGTPLILFTGVISILLVVLFFMLYQRLYEPDINPEAQERQRFTAYVTHYNLSGREEEIFSLIIQGKSNAEIAAALYISESTVKFHVGNIFKKTGPANRQELIADFRRSTARAGL